MSANRFINKAKVSSLNTRLIWGGLAILVGLYLFLATSYAIQNPDWQVPDEPAHYNYIRQIADEHILPVMETGDWDQAYQNALIASGFDPAMTGEIERVQFQDHQPPLYYLTAAPIFALTDGSITALRLLSVVYGLGILLCTFGATRLLFPDHPWLALGAVGFVVFIPQHLMFLGGINNDPLAILLICANLWGVIFFLKHPAPRLFHVGLLGLLVGLALLTKSTVYFIAGIVGLAILLRWRRERWPWRIARRHLVAFLAPALLLGGIWWLRNLDVYGGTDFLALQRHNQVAADQLQTHDYIHAPEHLNGDIGQYRQNYLYTTFHSFWGQFGWMGVPMPLQIYRILLVFTIVVLIGAGLYAWREDWPRRLAAYQRESLGLFGLTILLVFCAYLLYNRTFVQFQGRYLYPALLPLGAFVAIGITGWLPDRAVIRWLALMGFGVVMAGFAYYALTHYILGFLPDWG